MIRHLTIVSLLVTLALTASGCMDCSEAGCTAELQVAIAVDPARPVMLEVCRDGTCYGPVEVAETDRSVRVAYTDQLLVDASRFSNGGSDEVRLEATEFEVDHDVPPEEVAWTIRLTDGTRGLLDQTLTPAYVVSYPNGEACGPTCYSARYELDAQ